MFLQTPFIIGMVHFSPLEGSSGYEGDAVTMERAKEDLSVLQEGEVDAICFENNFDTPKFAELPRASAEHFRRLLSDMVPLTRLPWGVSLLWNDYRLGFRLCRDFGGRFVRVPVFADSVKTAYGVFEADPVAVMAACQEEGASAVEIFADVQVKHAKMITPRPFAESLDETIASGVDGVIVTGEWTGDPASVELCSMAHEAAASRNIHVLTGSGMTAENFSSYKNLIDGCFVGTAFKEGPVAYGSTQGPNIVEASRRYDREKIRAFMRAVRGGI